VPLKLGWVFKRRRKAGFSGQERGGGGWSRRGETQSCCVFIKWDSGMGEDITYRF